MIILDAVTKSLKIVLAGAVAATQLPVTAHYTDITTTAYTPGSNDTVTNSTSVVEFVAAPAASTQRHVESISVYNVDTAAATVTIQYVSAGGTRQIIKVTLQTLYALYYEHGAGWQIIDANGGIISGLNVSDVAYAASWDAVTNIAPSKNAVYDQIEAHKAVQTAVHGLAITAGKTLTVPEDVNLGGVLRTNLLTNSQWMAMSGSGLLQGANQGRQTDFEVGSALVTGTDADFSGAGNWNLGAGYSVTGGVLRAAASSSNANLVLSGLTIGKLYKFTLNLAAWTGSTILRIVAFEAGIGTVINQTYTSTTGGQNQSVIWEATAVNGNTIAVTGLGVTADFDNADVHEVTPGYVAADTVAPDTMTKTATLDIHRYWNAGSANTYGYGKYLLKLTKGAATAEYLNFGTAIDYRDCQGKPVTLGCYVYSVTATDNIKLSIHDGLTEVGLSSTFVGANTLTWVELPATLAAGATALTPRILCDGTAADVAYISEPILERGSSIGSGNYQPILNEVIWLQSKVNVVANFTPNAVSETLNIEALTSGQVGKGVKALGLQTTVVCSSAGYGFTQGTNYAIAAVAAQTFSVTGLTATTAAGDLLQSTGTDKFSAETTDIYAIQT